MHGRVGDVLGRKLHVGAGGRHESRLPRGHICIARARLQKYEIHPALLVLAHISMIDVDGRGVAVARSGQPEQGPHRWKSGAR